jgi:gliding motility-associated-like protein
VFTSIGPLCQNSAAPALPLTSNNGINGTWNPAAINTSTGGKATYTFTPAAGQCAATATMEVTVKDQITPVFTSIGPLCQNSAAPNLPLTSNNGITGTWSPALINTASAGQTVYTFTPAKNECAGATTSNIVVNAIQSSITDVSVCRNQLPYRWNNNSYNSEGSYQVKLTGRSGCDSIATLNLKFIAPVIPAFNLIGPLSQYSTPPALLSISKNNISGTWAPDKIDTSLPGTTVYTFTPSDGLCADKTQMSIEIKPVMIDAVISGAGVIGSCQQIKLDAYKSVGDITKYEWSALDPGGILTNSTEISTSFMLSTSYNGPLPSDFRIRLQVTDRSGKTDSDTVKVRIEALPRAFIASSGQPEKDGSMLVDGSASKGTGLNFKWSTSEGKIVGQANKPSAFLLGAGLYTLEITDSYGCKSTYTFKFPIEQYKIIANPDYARTSWSHDTTIYVMENDVSTAPLIPGTVRIIKPAAHGDTKVNPDGSVIYIPKERMSGKDEFIYEICDAVNLCDSALVTIYINDEEVQITEAFSPNGDGKNEQLVFKGLEHYPQSRLHIYTRSGQLVYQSNDYKNDWDGRITQSSMSNKKLVPTGVYYYVLELGGTTKSIKGFVYIGY